ncbi:hypothetical protein [Shouchella shacheensis]|uniref:hypothetical protein n=1 Tax=Shouchella shacheensis TaxID=1649580 RepID=UPI00073FD5E6|nr:hypothetical protein [Shouchella shacheensis]
MPTVTKQFEVEVAKGAHPHDASLNTETQEGLKQMAWDYAVDLLPDVHRSEKMTEEEKPKHTISYRVFDRHEAKIAEVVISLWEELGQYVCEVTVTGDDVSEPEEEQSQDEEEMREY